MNTKMMVAIFYQSFQLLDGFLTASTQIV